MCDAASPDKLKLPEPILDIAASQQHVCVATEHARLQCTNWKMKHFSEPLGNTTIVNVAMSPSLHRPVVFASDIDHVYVVDIRTSTITSVPWPFPNVVLTASFAFDITSDENKSSLPGVICGGNGGIALVCSTFHLDLKTLLLNIDTTPLFESTITFYNVQVFRDQVYVTKQSGEIVHWNGHGWSTIVSNADKSIAVTGDGDLLYQDLASNHVMLLKSDRSKVTVATSGFDDVWNFAFAGHKSRLYGRSSILDSYVDYVDVES
jgi:hypothetical protein